MFTVLCTFLPVRAKDERKKRATKASKTMSLVELVGLLLMANLVGAATTSTPTQLQVNYQRDPSLGVGPFLRFSWAVPPVANMTTGEQKSYSIVVTDADSGQVAWTSGLVKSSKSINIELDGRNASLSPGSAYTWTVACNGGPPSTPATFVSSLWDGFHPDARWVWAADLKNSQHYANLRSTAVAPAIQAAEQHQRQQATSSGGNEVSKAVTITRALLFVTAWQEPTMLASYKFYIDGQLVSLGGARTCECADVPGRVSV